MIITRRAFLAAAAPAALLIPAIADEILHPGRKFFLPPTKVFTGDEPQIVIPRFEYTLVRHQYTGRDGREHRSNFWVRHENLAQLQAQIDLNVRAAMAREELLPWGDPFLAIPGVDGETLKVLA